MKAFLQQIEIYFPKNKLTNQDISNLFPDWTIEKITQKVGIESRFIASNDETSVDLGIKATEQLFEKERGLKEKIDYILFCSQSPDYILPTSACIIQDQLGLQKGIGALDFNLGCSGYVYGLGLAKGLIISGQAENILLITAETYSKYINEKDRGNRTIFGDAATVSYINSEYMEQGLNAEIKNFSYGTDGSGADDLIVKNGGARNKCTTEESIYDEEGNFIWNNNNLYMNGKEIFNFTAKQVPELINQNLQKNHLELSDINQFIFHQANAYMLDFIRNKCRIPKEKFFVDIKNTGNTVSNSIPIALKFSQEQNRIKEEDNVLLCGFGVGLSMGSVVLKINSEK